MTETSKQFKFDKEDYILSIAAQSEDKATLEIANSKEEDTFYLEFTEQDLLSEENSFASIEDLVRAVFKGINSKKTVITKNSSEITLSIPSNQQGNQENLDLTFFKRIARNFSSGRKEQLKQMLNKRNAEISSKSKADKGSGKKGEQREVNHLLESHKKAKGKLSEMEIEISDLKNRESYLRKQFEKKTEELENINLPSFLNDKLENVLLNRWLPKGATKKLLYKASEMGFSAFAFHKHCDHQGPTLTVITTKDKVKFGGFTTCDWNSSVLGSFGVDDLKLSFLFNLNEAKRFPIVYESYANYSHKNCGPCFGGDWRGKLMFPFKSYRHDIFICSDANEQAESNINFPYCYQEDYFSSKNTLLQVKDTFLVSEIEVFKVKFDL